MLFCLPRPVPARPLTPVRLFHSFASSRFIQVLCLSLSLSLIYFFDQLHWLRLFNQHGDRLVCACDGGVSVYAHTICAISDHVTIDRPSMLSVQYNRCALYQVSPSVGQLSELRISTHTHTRKHIRTLTSIKFFFDSFIRFCACPRSYGNIYEYVTLTLSFSLYTTTALSVSLSLSLALCLCTQLNPELNPPAPKSINK